MGLRGMIAQRIANIANIAKIAKIEDREPATSV
jgi:hypothetical protein